MITTSDDGTGMYDGGTARPRITLRAAAAARVAHGKFGALPGWSGQ